MTPSSLRSWYSESSAIIVREYDVLRKRFRAASKKCKYAACGDFIRWLFYAFIDQSQARIFQSFRKSATDDYDEMERKRDLKAWTKFKRLDRSFKPKDLKVYCEDAIIRLNKIRELVEMIENGSP